MNTKLKQTLVRLGPLLGLTVVFTFFSILRPQTFLTIGNVEVMLLQTAVVGMAALGMTIIIISGGIDLSVGATIALSTVVVAMLLQAGCPVLLSALGGIGAGMACGALIGGLVTRMKLAPFIVTLGMWGAVRGLAKGLAKEQMVFPPSTWLNDLLTALPDGKQWMLFPAGVWLTLIMAAIIAFVLRNTRFGRHTFAIGSNEETARLCGVRIDRTKMLIYIVGAGFAGVAGVLQFSYLTMGDPTTANGAELDVIAAVVIGGGSLAGGVGSVGGSLIGAMIMTVVGNGCTKLGMANWVQEIVTGVIIIAAVALDQIRQRRSTSNFSG